MNIAGIKGSKGLGKLSAGNITGHNHPMGGMTARTHCPACGSRRQGGMAGAQSMARDAGALSQMQGDAGALSQMQGDVDDHSQSLMEGHDELPQ